MQLTAECPNCGTIPAPNFIRGEGTFRTEGSVVKCRTCGALAPIPDGIYGRNGKIADL